MSSTYDIYCNRESVKIMNTPNENSDMKDFNMN